jgi:hypothetical protein
MIRLIAAAGFALFAATFAQAMTPAPFPQPDARDKVKLPKRSHKGSYNDQASLRGMKFVEECY